MQSSQQRMKGSTSLDSTPPRPISDGWSFTAGRGGWCASPVAIQTAAKRILINIRSETIGIGRFGAAFAKLRCAVITDGFYEWPPDGGEPMWFHAAADGLVLLGGLLQLSTVTGAVPRFSVLTAPPNVVVAPVHDRMPVILDNKRLDEWLTSEPAVALQMLILLRGMR